MDNYVTILLSALFPQNIIINKLFCYFYIIYLYLYYDFEKITVGKAK